MKNKVRMALNILIIILMPFMMYINFGDTKVNVALADMILVFVGIIFIINIKEFFLQKRWVYLLYFGGLLFSLFLSQYMSMFNKEFLHVNNKVMIMEMVKTIIVAIYFFAALIFVKSEKDFKISLIAISLSCIPVMFIGAISYIYYLSSKVFFIDVYELKTLRFKGTFEDPNLCAFYFIIILFISMLNFKIHKNKLIRFIMKGISILCFFVILLTMSRGGWVALLVAMVIYIILNFRNLKKEIILSFLSLLVLGLITVDLDYFLQQGKISNDMISRIQNSVIVDVDDIDRVQLMKAAFDMGNDNFIFGIGKGSFPLNSYKYLSRDNIQYKKQYIPHNTILGFYAQQGIVGVLAFITIPIFIFYRLIRSRRNHSQYFVPLFVGLFVHSMTINVENVRFLWYILGLMLVSEELDIHLDFLPVKIANRRTFALALAAMFSLIIFLSIDLSRKLAADIYSYKGNAYIRDIDISISGDYILTFDIHTDENLHTIEVYDGNQLLKKMEFKSAYGVVYVPLYLENDCRVLFKSNEKGWMVVKNAHIVGDNKKLPLYNYILLPSEVENWANSRGYLVYSDKPSYKKKFNIEEDKLNLFEIFKLKVIKYSNLSHMYEFDIKSKQRVEENYQLELMRDYNSISDLLVNEAQRNLWTYRFTINPIGRVWEEGKKYTLNYKDLFSSETFSLYGRYYDNSSKVYIQESYFPIEYDIVKENQDIVNPGESQWINIRYNKDKDNIIKMISNGWVESSRMNLPKGDHEITFRAQGSYMGEYSKLRIRDSYLNEIAEIILDGTMKEYTVKYHADEDHKGISFVLELINYESEEGVGNREALLEDWVRVK